MILTTIIIKTLTIIFAVIALLFLALALTLVAWGVAQSMKDYIDYKKENKKQ